ncbi:hypothetical protein K503DRAFT_518603 [Rhizopogon vinicolor AM-OR11-026]|uniref:Uncharacterized protein n=1 Tax=Rhizopogon vinicolor AM-OR11-026 TaxID=1314800 RepID=A0A1B7MLN9_9AGAM|nr:hypothetical protein K503DRAFT_518603 [Rhizopogon vinicolor AM-OR11-026]
MPLPSPILAPYNMTQLISCNKCGYRLRRGGAGACDSGAESPSRTYYSPSIGLLHLSEIYGMHTWLNRTSRSVQRSLTLLTLQSLASCSSLLHILSSPHPCIGYAI